MARNKEVGLELPCYGRAPVGLISVEDMVGRHISHHCEITRNLGGLPPIIRIIAGRPNGRTQTDMFGLGTTMDRKRQGGTEPFSAGQSGADYALGLTKIPDDVETSLWGIEGQVEQRLDAFVLGQNALDQPAVVGAADGGLDVVLGVHAEHQHGRREYYLVVETHRVHGAARQLSEMVALAAVNRLGQGHLVGDAPVDVLEEGARLGVE